MDEVRVEIQLTNAIDDGLSRRKKLAPSKVRSVRAKALVDTSAVRLVLPSSVVDKLGLECVRTQVVENAAGGFEEVGITEPVYVEILGRCAADEAIVCGDEILIGRILLAKTDLHVDYLNHQLIPNPAHPNQPVSRV